MAQQGTNRRNDWGGRSQGRGDEGEVAQHEGAMGGGPRRMGDPRAGVSEAWYYDPETCKSYLLTVLRSSHYWHRPEYRTHCARDAQIPERSRRATGDTRYKKCGCPIQSACDGEGSWPGRSCSCADRVEGEQMRGGSYVSPCTIMTL